MQKDLWKKIFSAFPVNREMIWLNNCGTTSPSLNVVKDVSDFLHGYARSGILTSVKNYEETSSNIKKILADLLKCLPSELALIHNTAEGMNLISYGLRLHKGDTILLLENEYPSNVYPWQHWEQKGVILEFVPLGNSPDEFLNNFVSRLHEGVKVSAISLVHWCTGMPLPVRQISKICEERNISLVIDGAQGVGHIDLDLSTISILAMAFPAWKWLLGPLGLGVMYVNQKKIEGLDYVFKGQSSVKESDNYLPYKNNLKEGAARYEYSTPAFLEWVYFESALQELRGIGFDKVRGRIMELADYLRNGLNQSDYCLISDNFGRSQSGVVVFESDIIPADQINQELKKNKIIGAVRLNRVRLSPHIYNSFEQLDSVISLLNNIKRTKN